MCEILTRNNERREVADFVVDISSQQCHSKARCSGEAGCVNATDGEQWLKGEWLYLVDPTVVLQPNNTRRTVSFLDQNNVALLFITKSMRQ